MDRTPIKSKLFALLKSFNFWAVLLALILALGLARNWRWLRGNDEYRWRYYAMPGIEQRIWPAIIACVIIGLICFLLLLWSRKARGWRTFAILGLLFLAAVALQLALLRLEHPDPLATLFYRTVSTRNLGAFYYDATTTTDINSRLAQFPELMRGFHSSSPRTHPPGLQVLFWGTGWLLDKFPSLSMRIGPLLRTYLCNDPADSFIFYYPNNVLSAAGLQILMPFWGALSLFPLYGLARLLFNRQTAVRGVILLILAPSMILFAAHWSHFYTLLALVALYFLYLGLFAQSWWQLFLAGLIISAATFLSFSNLALIAVAGITLLVYWVQLFAVSKQALKPNIRAHWPRIWPQIAAFALGLSAVWAAYYLFYGVSVFEVYRQAMASHTAITGYRTYSLWLGANLFDFFLFLGIPTALAFGVMIVRLITAPGRRQRLRLETLPFYSFTLSIIALDLSGVSKGEVARLWMFLMPLAILSILPVVRSWNLKRMALVIGLLLFQVLVMGYYIRTIGGTNYPYYVPRDVQTAVPDDIERVQVPFSADETVLLQGYRTDLAGLPEGQIDLDLYWQAAQPLQHSYTVFVHLINAATGELVAQHDSLPQNGDLPTLCWQKGEIVEDRHLLAVPSPLPPGTYDLSVGLYRLDLLQAGDPNHRLLIDPQTQESTYQITEFQTK